MTGRMQKRIIFGSIMLAAMVGVLWLDWYLTRDAYEAAGGRWSAGPGAMIAARALPITCLLFLLSIPAVMEMRRLVLSAGVKFLALSGFVSAVGLATLPFWWQFMPAKFGALAVLAPPAGAVMLVFAEQMIRRSTEDALRKIAGTLLAVMYLGLGGAMVLAIRMDFNLPVLVLFLAAVKFTDIGAYFTGSYLGKHKLIPWLSPGKTWEGLLGGLVLAAVISIAVTLALGVRVSGERLGVFQAGVFGAAAGLAGQFGDLCESLLKRATSVKDSGSLVPEFGGVLDILDSPLLSAPVAYLLLLLMK